MCLASLAIGIPFDRLDSEVSMKRWNAGQIHVGLAYPACTSARPKSPPAISDTM